VRSGGVFAFTLERIVDASDTHPYRIQPHGRYAHNADYVCRTLQAAGFATVDAKDVVLRRERGQDVQGYLVVAR
jgi:predicted TPR repeat methyltransferase